MGLESLVWVKQSTTRHGYQPKEDHSVASLETHRNETLPKHPPVFLCIESSWTSDVVFVSRVESKCNMK
jgi:hypothetical protein